METADIKAPDAVAAQINEVASDSDLANHPVNRLWDAHDIPV